MEDPSRRVQGPSTNPSTARTSMQLDYILNQSRPSFSVQQEQQREYGSPQKTPFAFPASGPSQLDGADSSSDSSSNSNTNNNTTTQHQPQPQQKPQRQSTPTNPPATQTQFEVITAHTAKCDLCNNRNDSGMSRCLSCGWQSCHACTLLNGCTRTHNAGSRLHTGPVDRRQLVSGEDASRGRKRVKGLGRGSGTRAGNGNGNRDRRGAGTGVTRRSARQRGRGHGYRREERRQEQNQGQAHGRSGSSPTANPNTTPTPPSSNPPHEDSFCTASASASADEELSETEKMLQGARNIYAFTIEAHGLWAHKQRQKHQSQRQVSLPDPESSCGESAWWQQLVGVRDLHSYAQEEATRALEVYRRQETRGYGGGSELIELV